MNLFDDFGSYGPLLLIFLSMYLLWDNHNLFFYYTLGIFVNTILNTILKAIIQQPRPTEDVKKFNLALTNGKRFFFKDGVPFNIFGMPSGHSQETAFSLIYIIMVLQNTKITALYLIIMLFTMFQRIYTKKHFFTQVLVGGTIGLCTGYLCYYLAYKYIKNK